MKKIICLTIALCLVLGSFSFTFAADTAVSDATTHTRLQTIITWLQNTAPTYNLVNTLNTNILDIKNALIWNSGENSNNLIAYIKSIDSATNAIATYLTNSSNNGIVTVLNNILSELTWTDAGQNVIHGVQFIVDRINTIRTNTTNIASYNQTMNSNIAAIGSEILSSFPATVQELTSIDTTLSNTYTLENTTLPGIYAYAGSIDGTTQSMYDIQQVQLPKLENLKQALTNYNQSFYDDELTAAQFATYAHRNLIGSAGSFPATPWYVLPTALNNGGKSTQSVNWFYGTPIGNLMVALQRINENFVNTYQWRWSADLTNYNSTQTRTNWKTLASETFTPSSAIDGIYKWFGSIQTPIARLASVHASDEEIQAREYAANNQAAVTNNFINPSGDGSVPTSSFGSVSSLSSGVKTNLSTDASPSGIFDIFNSDHGSWFSQETADQLNTTQSTRKGSSFDTPLLDQQIDDIYSSLGVKK